MERNKMIAVAAVLILVVAAIGVVSLTRGGGDDPTDGITDAMGNEIAPLSGSQRIVSTTVTATEMLCDLGLRTSIVGATSDNGVYDVDQDVIGIDIEFDYPSTMQEDVDSGKVTPIGGAMSWTAETAAVPNPTVVVTEHNQLDTDASRMTQLQSLGIIVIVLFSDSGIDTILNNYSLLGYAFGVTERADEINQAISEMDSKIKNSVPTESDLKVAHICYCFGSFYIYNDSSTMGILSDLGCEIGLRSESSFTTISAEDIAAADLDLIIFDDMSTGLDWEEVLSKWMADPVMGEIDAIKNGMVYCLEHRPFQATSYSTVHFVEGEALVAAIVAGDSIGVEVPNIITDDNWKDFIQWVE